jgi:hypothetical protein
VTSKVVKLYGRLKLYIIRTRYLTFRPQIYRYCMVQCSLLSRNSPHPGCLHGAQFSTPFLPPILRYP